MFDLLVLTVIGISLFSVALLWMGLRACWGLGLAASLLQAAALSSLSSPRMTIPSASSGSGRCSAFASLEGAWRRLRPKQREVDHIQPAQDAVDDRPEDRVVGRVTDCDGEGAAKANAPLRTLCFHDIVAASVHLRSIINLASLQTTRRKPGRGLRRGTFAGTSLNAWVPLDGASPKDMTIVAKITNLGRKKPDCRQLKDPCRWCSLSPACRVIDTRPATQPRGPVFCVSPKVIFAGAWPMISRPAAHWQAATDSPEGRERHCGFQPALDARSGGWSTARGYPSDGSLLVELSCCCKTSAGRGDSECNKQNREDGPRAHICSRSACLHPPKTYEWNGKTASGKTRPSRYGSLVRRRRIGSDLER